MNMESPADLIVELPDEGATEALGAALARAVRPGTTLTLSGSLGAGKTRLTQAFSEALGIAREEVVSPTFVLARRHAGRLGVWHLDAYRVDDEDAFLDLGIEEMCAGDDVVCIEWGERFAGCLPIDRLRIELDVTGPSSRRAAFFAGGPLTREIVERLAPGGGESPVRSVKKP